MHAVLGCAGSGVCWPSHNMPRARQVVGVNVGTNEPGVSQNNGIIIVAFLVIPRLELSVGGTALNATF